MMKHFLFCGLLLAAMPAIADLQTDMMNDRLDRLDREMTLLQKKVYAPETNVTTTQKAEVDSSTLNELTAQLDEQNKVIAELTQKVEELTHAQAVLSEKLQHLNDDVDVRFQEQKPKKIETSKPNKTEKLSDKEAYDAAYNLLVKTKYAEAEKAFIAFLEDYPNSDLVGNANYWLGETYYVRGQYEVAAGVFSNGLTKYEKSSKAADNLLKLGLTMANMGKKEEACDFLKLMPEKFPKASETLTQRAAQEAKKLACP